MAADLKTLFQSFKTKVGDKLNALNTRINDILIGGISEDTGNSIGWGSDMLPYYRERTAEEIAEDYESVEGVERFTSTHKTNFDGFAEALGNKADLDPVTRKVLPSQLPAMSVTVTGTVNATETTFEEFLTNVNNYTFEDGNAIIIVSAPDVNGDKFTSHYLYNGGDRALETSYSRFNAERVEWEDVVNSPDFALRSEINGGSTTAPTELMSFTAGYQSGLTYNPSATFKEAGVVKNDSRTITADPADPSLDRFDLFVIDLTVDQIVLIKGTPASNPLYPEYDPLTQIPASFISIQAGATAPAGIGGVNIWTEGSEWSTAGAGADFDLANTESPAGGTYAIKTINPLINGQSLPFTAPVPKAYEDGIEISFKIKNITGGLFRWLVAGTRTNGRQASIFIDAPFNYSASSTNYQTLSVAIPSGTFGNITKISLVSGVAGLQYFLDDVKLVSGGGAVAPTGDFADRRLSNVVPDLTADEKTTIKTKLGIVETSGVTQQYVDEGLALKLNISELIDNLTSVSATSALSANQGRVLKGFIDSINTLLNSDDTTLDELQEIVTYIKQNKADLQNLSISNIAGLVDALAGKEPSFLKNTGFNKNFGTTAGTVAEGNHLHTEEEIIGTANENLTCTGAVSHNLSNFSDRYCVLTGNSTFSFTNTPASGKSFAKTMTVKSQTTQTLGLPGTYTIIGEYKATGVENFLQFKFSNFPTIGLKVVVTIYQV